MALEAHTRRIGEFDYTVTQMPARKANRILLKLGKTIAPVLLLWKGGGEAGALDGGSLASAIRELNEDDFEWVVDEFAKTTDVQINETQAPSLFKVFDLHFAGRQVEMFEWLQFCVEVNFAFLADALKTLSSAGRKSAAASSAAKASS